MSPAARSSEGRLEILRCILLYLSLFTITTLLCWIFWGWYSSDAVTNIHFKMKFTKNELYNYTNYITENIGNSLAPYDLTSPSFVPSICEFPNVDPYEPSIMKMTGLGQETLNCEGKFLPDLTYIHADKEIRVNASLVEEYLNSSDFQHCRYQQIFRHKTNKWDLEYRQWSKHFKDKIELPKDAEFFKVECTNNTAGLISKTFYYLIPQDELLDELDSLNLKKRQATAEPKETLSVIMIGMDALTRHQFFRACNKTYSYLMNSLKSFDFTMHSQVGRNTFPNFLPLFGGQSYDEITQWWSEKYYLDNIDLLWGTFEKAGYRTLYSEDCPFYDTFNYLKKGFRNAIARYHLRPLWLAMHYDEDISKKHPYCVGNQVEMKFHLNYVGRFLDTFPDKPVFAVAMLNKPTHDDVTEANMFDEHILNFYQSLNQKGYLNRSLLISFSDHGVRWGPIRESKNGYFASRTPYTILTFPDWFLRKYPDVAANLKHNTKRLTSHFDTHATLLDLLYFRPKTTPLVAPLRHGKSLFGRIPWDRTCKDASIPLEYCLCGYTGLEEVNITSNIAQRLANRVVDAINSKVDKMLCVVLKLHRIKHIIKTVLKENNSKTKGTIYTVNLYTTPGNGHFEANVYDETNSDDFEVTKDITRLEFYKGVAECMDTASLREFCFCRNLLANETVL